MRYQALRFRPTPDTTVRLLLTAVMSLVLAVMVLVSGDPVGAQSAATVPYSQEPSGLSRDEIVAQLDGSYQEAPVAGGIAADGNILEVFASADGLSWTIIVTGPDGSSRVVAEGEGWSFVTADTGLRI